MTSNHGMEGVRGACPRGHGRYRDADGKPRSGRFGELFPDLERLISKPADLHAVGAPAGLMDENVHGAGGSTTTPLGFVFLGQFIDHDITLDVTSSLDKVNDPEATRNFRTPALDLDCIYGAGPEANRHLYYHAPPNSVGRRKAISGKHLLTLNDDLARAPSWPRGNLNQAALIGDHRNDENRVVSQLQLLMHRFHNKNVDRELAKTPKVPDGEVFENAQRTTRWHYQWIVVHDFLTRMVGAELVEDILCNGRKIYHCPHEPFIPIEFAAAAYRFGHSMVSIELDYNATHQNVPLFGSAMGTGFQANRAGPIDWANFFGAGARSAGAVDTRLPAFLLNLPFVEEGEKSLAVRNLLRGQSFGLPSGQAVHAAIEAACGATLAKPDLAGLGLPGNLAECTPLWLYILAEGALSGGQQLGPVGGRIVAEVLIGLLECDPTCYLGSNRSWSPELGSGAWDMATLIAYVQ